MDASEKTQLLADKTTAENLLDAQYGVSEYLEENMNYTYAFLIPQKVWDIRPRPMDLEVPEDKVKYWPAAEALEQQFKRELSEKAPYLNLKKLNKALDYIRTFHFHQERKSGEPYYMHPIEVARIVLSMIDDKNSKVYEKLQANQENTILAALLHDILEDTALENSGIQIVFGHEVANIVKGLTKINAEGRPALLTNIQAFSKLITQDPIVVCIKLADRVHNIMTIDGHPSEEKRRAVAQETLDFFIKPAQELGFDQIVQNLENACKYIIDNGKLAGFKFNEK
jgi:(p)ppGpp synthase/HD superfamily hydrolase